MLNINIFVWLSRFRTISAGALFPTTFFVARDCFETHPPSLPSKSICLLAYVSLGPPSERLRFLTLENLLFQHTTRCSVFSGSHVPYRQPSRLLWSRELHHLRATTLPIYVVDRTETSHIWVRTIAPLCRIHRPVSATLLTSK